MSEIGIGVLLSRLGGNWETIQTIKQAIDKEISSIVLKDNELFIGFVDGYKIKIFDDGQSSCEHRYITTDDDLQYYVGAKFLKADTAEAPNIIEDSYSEHEVQFLNITTSKGVFTLETHNEHDGYYGGFAICAREDK